MVTCVPPYVPERELALLPRDAREHEPRSALVDGDADGLGTARRAVDAAARLLAAGGSLLIEAGDGQCPPLAETVRRAGFGEATVHGDEDGEARALEARRA